MNCPKCKHPDTKVVDSRSTSFSVKRRRVCTQCMFRFNTIETASVDNIYVEKRNGSKVLFNQEKLEAGIRKAFNKRQINEKKFRVIIQSILEDIMEGKKKTIKSTKIGRIVLKNLKLFDEAAYICYWSMFGNFENVNDFNKLIKQFN